MAEMVFENDISNMPTFLFKPLKIQSGWLALKIWSNQQTVLHTHDFYITGLCNYNWHSWEMLR